jgi:hypothetical protein
MSDEVNEEEINNRGSPYLAAVALPLMCCCIIALVGHLNDNIIHYARSELGKFRISFSIEHLKLNIKMQVTAPVKPV